MTTSFLLTRAHDHAVLGVRLDGFDITGGTATAGAGGGTIGLVLPPQHVLEDTLNPPFPDAVVLRAELSGPSSLTFAVPAGSAVPLTAAGVLAACDLDRDGAGGGLVDSSVELPARLRFAVSGAEVAVARRPLTIAGASGPWRARLDRSGAAPMRAIALDPALAGAPDPYADFSPPLSPSQRLQIADHAAVDPAVVHRLELTSLGGSIDVGGSWEGFSWSERVTGGRDQSVQVSQRVKLYPFGFEGVLTTICTRDSETVDGPLLPPGAAATLLKVTTLRITKAVVRSDDGRAMSRTFPFRAVELLPSTFDSLAEPAAFLRHTRVTPDVQTYVDQLDQAVTDRDAAADLWHSYTDGQLRTIDDLRRCLDTRAADYDNAWAELGRLTDALADIEARKAGRQEYLDRANEHYARADALEETDPEAARAEREAGDADMQQADSPDYYFDPSAERAFRAALPGAQRAFDDADAQVTWAVQHEARTRDDAVALGELAPAISDAANRWPELDRVAAELAAQVAELTALSRPLDVAAWPVDVDGGTVRFPVRLHPLPSGAPGEGAPLDVTMPLVLVYDVVLDPVPQWDLPGYSSLEDPDLAAALDVAWAGPPDAPIAPATFAPAAAPASVVDVAGAVIDVVGASVPKPSDRQTVALLNIVGHHGADPFVPSLGRVVGADGASGLAARPAMAVHLPALQRLAGAALPEVDAHAVVGFAPQFVDHGEAADVLFRTVGQVTADFTRAADRTGGLAALDVVSDAISRERGPAQLAALLGSDPDPAKLIGEAATLLGFKLRDLVAHLPALKPPTIVTDTVAPLAAGASPAEVAAWTLASSVPSVTVSWEHVPLQDFLAFKTNGSAASPTELNLTVKAGAAGTTTRCSVDDFALQFPFEDSRALIRLSFRSLSFNQRTTVAAAGAGVPGAVVSPPEVHVDWAGLEFKGELNLLAELQRKVAVVGSVAKVDAGPHGVVATTTLPVPDVRCGAFALSNLGFHSRVDVPFDGTPVAVEVGFASRARPFSLSVLSFAGGGYITVGIDAAGPRVEAALEFGAQLSVNFLVAEGEVHAFGGVSYLQKGEDVELSGYLRLGGSLEILHLVTVRVELRIALAYDGHRLVGRATLVLELDLTLWSDKIEIDSGEWVLAGSDPPGAAAQSFEPMSSALPDVDAALAAVEADVTDEELAAWQAYRAVVPA
ncbi:MAG: hypothetical protein H6529_14215 [Nocardioides sp.]|nr:hypothetical protein [Nocardioides sp.]